jgi:carbamate kinase
VREQPVVVALGGNAIAPPGSRSPIPAQYERTMETAHHLVHLAERPLVVTHGNGPQVGNVLLCFLARGGRRAVITTPELSEKALAGGIGTQVLP